MRTVSLRVRESFWFLPAVFGVGAIVAAQLLVFLDQAVIDASGTGLGFLDALSASGGRSILTTIGTAMLTVAGTSFSITISVLATTSSTYGPRLVRNFMADRSNQLVLAAFTSTFLYSIVVLRSVHTDVDDGTAFVPVIAVHVAVLLGILDVGVLVFFIHHIALSVQITSLQKQVQDDLSAAVDHVFHEGDNDQITTHAQTFPALQWNDVTAVTDGYVQSVQWQRLVSWAHEHGRIIDAVAMPGEHIITGDTMLRLGVPMGAVADAVDDDDTADSSARRDHSRDGSHTFPRRRVRVAAARRDRGPRARQRHERPLHSGQCPRPRGHSAGSDVAGAVTDYRVPRRRGDRACDRALADRGGSRQHDLRRNPHLRHRAPHRCCCRAPLRRTSRRRRSTSPARAPQEHRQAPPEHVEHQRLRP